MCGVGRMPVRVCPSPANVPAMQWRQVLLIIKLVKNLFYVMADETPHP